MDRSLRILILEDNPADAELVSFELEDAGIVFTSEVVMTEKDFIRGLHEFSPDLILSDYDLPQYTGAQALAEAKNLLPDVPFILVTGAVSEDRAIEILTSGAKDYVMKNRLSRLAPAVQRALAEAAEHRARKDAEQELRAASHYSRSLIEASLDPLVTISPGGKIMDVNKATEEITGVSRDKLIGKDFADYFTDPGKARAGYERAFLNGSVRDYPLELRHTSGRVTNVLYNATTYTNEKGEVQGVFAAARDVTELKQTESALREAQRILETKVRDRTRALKDEIDERRRAEEALRQVEERQHIVLESNFLGTFDIDLRSGEEHWNTTEYELLGLSPDNAPASFQTLLSIVHPDDVDRITDHWNEAKIKGILDIEFRIVRTDGQVRWLAGKGKAFREAPTGGNPAESGRIVRFTGVNFDITERKRSEEETRRLMNAVTQEKDRLSALINSINDEVWLADTEKRFTLANPSALREFGLTGEDVDVEAFAAALEVYRPDGSIRPVDESPALRALHGNIIKNEEEIVRTPATGELRYRQVSSSPVRDASGDIVGSVSVIRDVTERKRSEQRWATTLASIGDAVIVANTRGRISFMNAMAEQLTGWSASEAMDRPVTDVFRIIDERTRRAAEDPVARILREGTIVGLANHTLLVGKSGEVIPIDDSGAPIIDKAGGTLGAVLVFRDITKQRQAQTEMAHVASFVMLNPNPVTEIDLDGVVHFANPASEILFPDLRKKGFAHPWFAGWECSASMPPQGGMELKAREIKVGDKWYGQMMRFMEDSRTIRIYGRSITKRKLAEAALQASEERLRYALETSHTGAWELNLNDHSASRSLEHDRIFGYLEPLAEWTYETFLNHVIPEDRSAVDAKFQRSIRTGGDWNFDCRIRRADGEVRWIWATGSHRRDENGRPHSLTGIVQDITLRKLAEERLRKSQEEYRDLIESSGSVILRADKNMCITFMNQYGLQFFGYAADEIIGRSALGTIIPETDSKGTDFARMLEDLKEHPEKYHTNVHQNLCKDGRLVWMSWTNRPIYDDRGNFKELLVIGNDLSRLREAEERYHTLFNTQIEGFCIIDVLFDADNRPVDYTFLETNPAFEKQTGLHDVQGKNITELIPDNDAHWFEIYGRVALTGEPARLENKVQALGRWYEVFAHRIGGPESRKVAVLFNDVTERRRAEEVLKEYAADLEEANRELESFSYSVSHDLRAPLRAIDGLSKMILRRQGDRFDEETRRQFKLVRDNARAMEQLIDDLLALSRLSRQDLNVKLLDVRQLVEKTWQELQNVNPDRTMTLKMKTTPRSYGDKALIKQVLVNILGNAVKFTRNRNVAVIEVGGHEEGKDIVYYIRDNGIGFDMEFHDKLFGVFQRLHDASEYEGTGVGMALAQRIIHRHKGRIWAEGKVNEGAVFYFTLPKNG